MTGLCFWVNSLLWSSEQLQQLSQCFILTTYSHSSKGGNGLLKRNVIRTLCFLLSADIFMLLRLLLFTNGPVRDSWLELSDRPLQLDWRVRVQLWRSRCSGSIITSGKKFLESLSLDLRQFFFLILSCFSDKSFANLIYFHMFCLYLARVKKKKNNNPYLHVTPLIPAFFVWLAVWSGPQPIRHSSVWPSVDARPDWWRATYTPTRPKDTDTGR